MVDVISSLPPLMVDGIDGVLRYMVLGTASAVFCCSSLKESMAMDTMIGDTIHAVVQNGDGPLLVRVIEKVSRKNMAAKLHYVHVALAACSVSQDLQTRRAAFEALPRVCRIPTHLFEFLELSRRFAAANLDSTGWGRARRAGVARWYGTKPNLKEAVTKYKKRHGWSHRDAIKLSHARGSEPVSRAVFAYVFDQDLSHGHFDRATVEYLEASRTVAALGPDRIEECVALIKAHGFKREHLSGGALRDSRVWDALLDSMPPTALLRNLGKLSSFGENLSIKSKILAKLADAEGLSRARIHPYAVLLARSMYGRGKGDKGSLEWKPDMEIIEALDTVFERMLGIPEPAWTLVDEGVPPGAQRVVVQAIDVSGSMAWSPVAGAEVLDARTAACALAYITAKRSDEDVKTIGFGNEVQELTGLASADSLTTAMNVANSFNEGSFDVVLILDLTASMSTWISAAQRYIVKIIDTLGKWFRDSDRLRIGFVGYRDIKDADRFVIVQPTPSCNDVKNVISKQVAEGGADIPEDVAGALDRAMGLEFRQDAARAFIHITDAPCHGTRYHDGDNDHYPQGDPSGLDPERLMEKMARAGIDYLLVDATSMHSKSPIEKMSQIFRAAYDGCKGRTSLPMETTRVNAFDDGEPGRPRLDTAILRFAEKSAAGGGTSIEAPLRWALQTETSCDAFVIYTDQADDNARRALGAAIDDYRLFCNPETRLALVSLSGYNGKARFDNADMKTLEIAGFDAASVTVLGAFLAGALAPGCVAHSLGQDRIIAHAS
jgi:60 kDa SS-A/Ro ribonucleoprotein